MINFINKLLNKIFTTKINLIWLWIITVFLFSIDLFGKAKFIMIALVSIGLIIADYKKYKFKASIDHLLILLFSISYFCTLLYYKPFDVGSMFLYLIAPIALFSTGYLMAVSEKDVIIKTIFAIALGNLTHGVLNILIHIKTAGIFSLQRNIMDIWTGVEMTATGQGTNFTIMGSLLFFAYLLWQKRNSKRISILLFSGVLFSFFSSFILGNRTLPITIVVVFIANILLYGILVKEQRKIISKIVLGLVIFSVLFTITYSYNLFGIKDFITYSSLYSRMNSMSLTEDPRSLVYNKIWNQFTDYPFGGYKMELGLHYAHNLWLDVLYATGFIPFFFLISFTLSCLLNLFNFVKSDKVEVSFKFLVFSIYLGYLLNFMVEPILEGAPLMFLSFCMLNGMTKKYLYIARKQKNNALI